jgi:hypothetical protein
MLRADAPPHRRTRGRQLYLGASLRLSAAAASRARAEKAEQVMAICRHVLQGGNDDLLRHILHLVQDDTRTFLRAACVCVAWRCATHDEARWRDKCTADFALAQQVMDRALVHTPMCCGSYRQLFARLFLADRRARSMPTTEQLARMPPLLRPPAPVRREDYMIGVEVCVKRSSDASTVHWCKLCELTGAGTLPGQLLGHELMDVKNTPVAGTANDAHMVLSDDVSSFDLSVFLLRKTDNELLTLGHLESLDDCEVDSGVAFNSFTFNLRNTGEDSEVGKWIYFEALVYQQWDYDNDAGTVTGVHIALDTDEGGGMDEQPISTVDTMLQLLETPALADHWVSPVSLAPPLARVEISDTATAQSSEAAENTFFGGAKRLKAGFQRTFNDFFASARARADIAAADRQAAAWRQIESATAVLSRILGSLPDAKELSRAGEVKWSWYVAAQADIAWQQISTCSDFPLLSVVHRSYQVQHAELSGPAAGATKKGVYIQRVRANKESTATAQNPLLPDADRSAYLIGIELTNSSDDRLTPLLTSLTDLSELSEEAGELALVLDVPASPWISTATFNPLLSVTLVRKRDGRVLVLAQHEKKCCEPQPPHVMVHWQMRHTNWEDIAFCKPFFEATVFCAPEDRQPQSSAGGGTAAVPGLTVTGVSIALEDRSQSELSSMTNMNELLHALESPCIADRWV